MEDFAGGMWKDLVLSEPNHAWGTSWTAEEKHLKGLCVTFMGGDV